MYSKFLVKFLVIIAVIIVSFISVLSIHIYFVSPPTVNNNRNWQLSRIDFDEELDSIKENRILTAISGIDGIKKYYLNSDNRALVYVYERSRLDSKLVFTKFMSQGSFKAHRYEPDPKNIANSCPILDKNSLTYKLGVHLKKIQEWFR